MKTLSREEARRRALATGATLRMDGKVLNEEKARVEVSAPRPKPSPEPPKEPPKDSAIEAQNQVLLETVKLLIKQSINSTEAIQEIKTLLGDRKPPRWKLDVKRDSAGRAESIIATPLSGKE